MPKKPNTKTAKTSSEILNHFRELCEISKTNIIQQLNQASTQGTFNFEAEIDNQRMLSLMSSILDTQNAEKYMQLQNFIK